MILRIDLIACFALWTATLCSTTSWGQSCEEGRTAYGRMMEIQRQYQIDVQSYENLGADERQAATRRRTARFEAEWDRLSELVRIASSKCEREAEQEQSCEDSRMVRLKLQQLQSDYDADLRAYAGLPAAQRDAVTRTRTLHFTSEQQRINDLECKRRGDPSDENRNSKSLPAATRQSAEPSAPRILPSESRQRSQESKRAPDDILDELSADSNCGQIVADLGTPRSLSLSSDSVRRWKEELEQTEAETRLVHTAEIERYRANLRTQGVCLHRCEHGARLSKLRRQLLSLGDHALSISRSKLECKASLERVYTATLVAKSMGDDFFILSGPARDAAIGGQYTVPHTRGAEEFTYLFESVGAAEACLGGAVQK